MNIDDFKLLTERLELRPHRAEDADFMVELNSDPEVTRYVPDGPLEGPHQANDLIVKIRNQFMDRKIGRFLVIERQTGKKLGWCGLKWLEDVQEIDLGYRFMRSAWGQGYAFEAAKACLEYGFNSLNFERITAQIMPDNKGSIGVAKKLQMKELNHVIEDDLEFVVFEIQKADFNP